MPAGIVFRMRKGLCGALLIIASSVSHASTSFSTSYPPDGSIGNYKKILLIPIDDRPATGQFPAMIGAIADVRVQTPPAFLLGRFLNPGSPDALLDWLESQDLRQYSAIVASADMIAYGGLIASRTGTTTLELAKSRAARFEEIRSRFPQTKCFVFSSLMRLAPTATTENRPWRENLVRTVISRERFLKRPMWENFVPFFTNSSRLPEKILADFDAVRARNFEFQTYLMNRTKAGSFDFLVLGQDDAQPEGPQIAEQQKLRSFNNDPNSLDRIYFCEGIDQHANVLVSRAILSTIGWKPRVRVVYTDNQGAELTPTYEIRPLKESVNEQIIASGGEIAKSVEDSDYSLYINTPNPSQSSFATFSANLGEELEMGFPVAVADVNLGKTGTGDPNLFDALTQGDRAMKLIGYAGWNTAGNTIGTTIPMANVYLAARRLPVDPLQRELNQRAFLLHRLVNDFEYHRFTRPMAYEFIDNNPPATREETYGERFESVNRLVQQDLSQRLNRVFTQQFLGRTFFAGTRQYVLDGIDAVSVDLPWPRAYEVRLGFQLRAQEVKR